MGIRILVPTDGSDSATAALEHALDVAADRGATVHVLNVADTKQPSLARLGTDVVDVLEREGEAIVSDAADRAAERGVSVSTHVVQGEPREAIVDSITDNEFDLVVMGAHGRRGLGEYVLGSVTDYVVNMTDVPVLTVRAAEDATRPFPYDDVLVPTDGSVHARAAVELGATIAARHDATIHLLSVVDELPELPDAESGPLSEQITENLQEVLDEDAATARRAGVENVTTAIATGSVPREVTSYVDAEGIDLVVMGTHGRTGLDRHLLGSFTERVIRTSSVPVLTTRRADEMD
ncbi:universal stress protein [Halosolutus halophilus]|uniref:universal stress protein n=1 Tax=Halosolutus halophilus TaxID=1552990 RepID=UPI002234FDAA|nr:universal stress protein [Halosolutus halophilus]